MIATDNTLAGVMMVAKTVLFLPGWPYLFDISVDKDIETERSFPVRLVTINGDEPRQAAWINQSPWRSPFYTEIHPVMRSGYWSTPDFDR